MFSNWISIFRHAIKSQTNTVLTQFCAYLFVFNYIFCYIFCINLIQMNIDQQCFLYDVTFFKIFLKRPILEFKMFQFSISTFKLSFKKLTSSVWAFHHGYIGSKEIFYILPNVILTILIFLFFSVQQILIVFVFNSLLSKLILLLFLLLWI